MMAAPRPAAHRNTGERKTKRVTAGRCADEVSHVSSTHRASVKAATRLVVWCRHHQARRHQGRSCLSKASRSTAAEKEEAMLRRMNCDVELRARCMGVMVVVVVVVVCPHYTLCVGRSVLEQPHCTTHSPLSTSSYYSPTCITTPPHDTGHMATALGAAPASSEKTDELRSTAIFLLTCLVVASCALIECASMSHQPLCVFRVSD